MKDSEAMLLLIAGAAVLFIIWLLRRHKPPDITDFFQPVSILTDREREFYSRLKPLADEYGLQVYMKVRLADLIVPKPREENPFWMECFNKIKAKHIDFALADGEANIVALIELDDTTHARPGRVERDEFVNAVLEKCGYTLLRTYGELDVIEEFLD